MGRAEGRVRKGKEGGVGRGNGGKGGEEKGKEGWGGEKGWKGGVHPPRRSCLWDPVLVTFLGAPCRA